MNNIVNQGNCSGNILDLDCVQKLHLLPSNKNYSKFGLSSLFLPHFCVLSYIFLKNIIIESAKIQHLFSFKVLVYSIYSQCSPRLFPRCNFPRMFVPPLFVPSSTFEGSVINLPTKTGKSSFPPSLLKVFDFCCVGCISLRSHNRTFSRKTLNCHKRVNKEPETKNYSRNKKP